MCELFINIKINSIIEKNCRQIGYNIRDYLRRHVHFCRKGGIYTSNKNDYVDISSSKQLNKVYKKKNGKGTASRIVVLVLSIIMLIGGSGLIYYYSVLDSLNYKEVDNDSNVGATEVNVTETIVAENSLLSSEDVLNILIFGQDAKESETEKYGRADTTILLSLDNVHQKIKLTSFQRDTYVTIPGHGKSKLNSAFSLGGVSLAIQTIEANFGIKVDKYAIVDFDSFKEIINVLGGIDIELSLEEIEYINAQIDVNDQLDETNFLEYDSTQETQMMHLDGQQALWYARDRGADELGGVAEYSFSGDDWDRTKRQRNLIETLLKELKEETSLTDLVAIVNKIGPLVTTNLKKSDITFLVSNVTTYLDYEMVEMTMPTEGTWQYAITEDQQSVIAVTDWTKVRYELAQFIYEDQVSAQQNTASSQSGQVTSGVQ